MTDEKLLERIIVNPKVMMGKSEDHRRVQRLEKEDVQACILFASKALENTAFMPLTVEQA